MATIEELSNRDFEEFKKDLTNAQKYEILSDEKKAEYENNYKSHFSNSFTTQRELIMQEENLDKSSAGTIMLDVIKKAHSKGEFLMDISGNLDTEKFNQIKADIKAGLQSGKYDSVIQENRLKEIERNDYSKENANVLDNAQERKEYFQKLFEEYNNLETFEEKLDFYCKNIEDIRNLSEEKQKIRLNQYEIGNEIENLYDKIENDNREASDQEIDKLKEDALKEMAVQKECSVEELGLIYDRKRLIEKINIEKNSDEKSKFQEDLKDLDEKLDSLDIELERSDEKIENETKDINKELFNATSEKLGFSDISLETSSEEPAPEDFLFEEPTEDSIMSKVEEEKNLKKFISPENNDLLVETDSFDMGKLLQEEMEQNKVEELAENSNLRSYDKNITEEEKRNMKGTNAVMFGGTEYLSQEEENKDTKESVISKVINAIKNVNILQTVKQRLEGIRNTVFRRQKTIGSAEVYKNVEELQENSANAQKGLNQEKTLDEQLRNEEAAKAIENPQKIMESANKNGNLVKKESSSIEIVGNG